ncbi:DNA polymerase III subunit delta' [bacterium]|nr:DNA polymerase III subunit delta' [bacterium]
MPFKDIIGHDKTIRDIQRLMDEDRLPHALLFTGPEGIGKKLTGFSIAKALMCKESKNDFCDSCPSCQSISKGNHPDVALIQPEGNSIKIEQMREWQKTLEYRPYLGSHRVTIIDQAEKMTQAAANSILKALEEPPLGTLICLVTIETRDMLPTIVSRCQVVRFSPLSCSDFCKILLDKSNISGPQARLVYNISKGQLSKGISMNMDYLSKLRDEWIGSFRSPSFDNISVTKTDQANLLEGLEIMAYWVRDMVLLQLGVDDALLTHQDMLGELKKEARKVPYRLAMHRIDIILQTMEALQNNANPKIAMDCLLWQWDKSTNKEMVMI